MEIWERRVGDHLADFFNLREYGFNPLVVFVAGKHPPTRQSLKVLRTVNNSENLEAAFQRPVQAQRFFETCYLKQSKALEVSVPEFLKVGGDRGDAADAVLSIAVAASVLALT